jgi:prepilin-type N-terminal cleavage/methylation domain-containing protein
MTLSTKSGFTVVELLVVIVIIGILTTLTIGGARVLQDKAARSRAATEIAAIELALERYKIDNGDYPAIFDIGISSGIYDSNLDSSGILSKYEGSRVSMSSDGIITAGTGGRLLFAELMGKTKLVGTGAGSGLTADGRTQYIELKNNQVNDPTDNSYIQDPWGNPYGYFYDDQGISEANTNQSLFNHAAPDLWSTSNEKGTVSATGVGTEDYGRYLRWTTNWPNK